MKTNVKKIIYYFLEDIQYDEMCSLDDITRDIKNILDILKIKYNICIDTLINVIYCELPCAKASWLPA
jgi:hypothetical protein